MIYALRDTVIRLTRGVSTQRMNCGGELAKSEGAGSGGGMSWLGAGRGRELRPGVAQNDAAPDRGRELRQALRIPRQVKRLGFDGLVSPTTSS